MPNTVCILINLFLIDVFAIDVPCQNYTKKQSIIFFILFTMNVLLDLRDTLENLLATLEVFPSNNEAVVVKNIKHRECVF